jgi:hypothetical protein
LSCRSQASEASYFTATAWAALQVRDDAMGGLNEQLLADERLG